ncbi:MAG: hypothetical protein QXJ75_02235 [Candidatus Bathyarchaeia archaeon]
MPPRGEHPVRDEVEQRLRMLDEREVERLKRDLKETVDDLEEILTICLDLVTDLDNYGYKLKGKKYLEEIQYLIQKFRKELL